MKEYFLKHRLFQKILPLAVLFLATIIVYSNSLHNEFLWDDDSGILNNAYIRDWKYFLNFFSEGIYAGSGTISFYWRPAVLSVFSIEWRIFHEWVVGYHAMNILLHTIDAILIFYLFRLIFRKTLPAFTAALLFAVHPLQTEAVTYISGIADPLAALFILLGTLSYAKARLEPDRKRFYLLATALLFLFALTSKESAIMMPGLLFLVDLFIQRESMGSWRTLLPILKKTAPFLGILGVYVLARLTVLDFMKDLPASPLFFPLYERILAFFHAFSIYLRLLFAPLHLHMEWALPVGKSLFSLPVAIGGLFIVFFLVLIATQFKKRPEVSFGLAWFFVALSPNMNIFLPTVALLSEHWLYLSLPAFFFAAIAILDEFFRTSPHRPILMAIFIAWVVWLGNLTLLRNRDWANPITFFTKTVIDAPHSNRAILGLGIAHERRGEYEAALDQYEQSLLKRPAETAYFTRAELYQKMGRESDALKDYERSFELNPGYSPAFNVLLEHFTSHGKYEKAHKILEMRTNRMRDPIEVQKLLITAFGVAVQENNKALKERYLEKMTENENLIQNTSLIKFGAFLNTYLDR